MRSVTELLKEACELPPDQRVTLAHRLIAITEPAASPVVEARWDAVIRDRIARYDRGETQAHPIGEVLSRIDSALKNDD